jgi:hypothetical protein
MVVKSFGQHPAGWQWNTQSVITKVTAAVGGCVAKITRRAGCVLKPVLWFCGGRQAKYSGIEQRARAEDAETTGVTRSFAGRYTDVGSTRQKHPMIATVTNQGKTRWLIIDDAFDSKKRSN